MRFLCSAPTRRLGATGSVVCVLKVCVIMLNTYNYYMHTTNWRYLQALWVLQIQLGHERRVLEGNKTKKKKLLCGTS